MQLGSLLAVWCENPFGHILISYTGLGWENTLQWSSVCLLNLIKT